MAQVKLAEHQGAEEEGTATKRYGPKGVCETLTKTLFKGNFSQPSIYFLAITKRICYFVS